MGAVLQMIMGNGGKGDRGWGVLEGVPLQSGTQLGCVLGASVPSARISDTRCAGWQCASLHHHSRVRVELERWILSVGRRRPRMRAQGRLGSHVWRCGGRRGGDPNRHSACVHLGYNLYAQSACCADFAAALHALATLLTLRARCWTPCATCASGSPTRGVRGEAFAGCDYDEQLESRLHAAVRELQGHDSAGDYHCDALAEMGGLYLRSRATVARGVRISTPLRRDVHLALGDHRALLASMARWRQARNERNEGYSKSWGGGGERLQRLWTASWRSAKGALFHGASTRQKAIASKLRRLLEQHERLEAERQHPHHRGHRCAAAVRQSSFGRRSGKRRASSPSRQI
eukprot:TRINITY_DN12123_c0_g1_i2.p1 TRINITY_DN12123_c0_g1~~TRINITY_DN12123_c0_g1_i2.p1  ORF type:complete len:367 (-),score=31.92 TRINITY_DN12123_c0_g1_i2:188-1225(-)